MSRADVDVRDEPEGSGEHVSTFKWPEPPLFFGERKRDAVTVHDWLELMQDHIQLRDMKVQSRQAMRFAKLYLRGAALTWARTYEGKQSYLELAAALRSAMSPFAEQHMQRDRLKRLSHRDSLQAYVDLFRTQSLLVPNMSPEDKVDLFITNLKPYLRGPVRLHLLDKSKEDLDLAMKAAAQIAYELRKDRPPSNPSPSQLSSAQAADATRKCYKCGATDHLRAQCPKLRKGGGGHKGGKGGPRPSAKVAAAAAAEAQENA